MSRINGVGNFNVFGTQYAMRIWLDPNKLNSFLAHAGRRHERAARARTCRSPAASSAARRRRPTQRLTATITEATLLRTPEEFGDILLKVNPDGSQVRLRDVARIELGAENFNVDTKYNGQPAAAIGVQLAPGANALATAEAVRARHRRSSRSISRRACSVVYPYDTTPFVKVSIEEVVKTLFEGIVLVFLVMYLFLQNIRATLIPTHRGAGRAARHFRRAWPRSGFTINTLSMFGLVLAIGLLVDDAIVVVENVERIIAEEGLVAARGDAQGDGPDHRRAGRRSCRAVRSVRAGGVLDRVGRRDLSAVLADHRRGDGCCRCSSR